MTCFMTILMQSLPRVSLSDESELYAYDELYAYNEYDEEAEALSDKEAYRYG